MSIGLKFDPCPAFWATAARVQLEGLVVTLGHGSRPLRDGGGKPQAEYQPDLAPVWSYFLL